MTNQEYRQRFAQTLAGLIGDSFDFVGVGISRGPKCWTITVSHDDRPTLLVNVEFAADSNAKLIAAAPNLLQELKNIANARVWDREYFADAEEFMGWAQSRARVVIAFDDDSEGE